MQRLEFHSQPKGRLNNVSQTRDNTRTLEKVRRIPVAKTQSMYQCKVIDSPVGPITLIASETALVSLMWGICPTLDFAKATEWVHEQFNNGLLPNLDAVLIMRVQPTQDENPDGSLSNIATTEYHLAVNQQRHSSGSIKSIFGVDGISPTIPVGKTSDQPTKFQIQVDDNQSIDLGGHYVFASGEHYYHKSGFGEVHMTTYPYTVRRR